MRWVSPKGRGLALGLLLLSAASAAGCEGIELLPAPSAEGELGAADGGLELALDLGGAGASPAAAYLREAMARSCRQHDRCRESLVTPVVADVLICHPAFQARRARELLEKVEGNLLDFDPAVGEEVLAALDDSTPCTELRATDLGVEMLEMAFFGRRPEGERCEEDLECASGGCVLGEGPSRYCEAMPGEGEPCADRSLPVILDGPMCAPGLLCDYGLRVCTRFLPEGSLNCRWSRDCAPGLTCLAGAGCVRPRGLGEACNQGPDFSIPGRLSECREGLVCTRQGCGRGQPIGQPCSRGGDGTDPCGDGARCSAEGRCVEVAYPGGPCSEDDACPEGFSCDGRCRPLPVLEEPCDLSVGCLEGLCDGARCRPAPEGEYCADHPLIRTDRSCEVGLYCDVWMDFRCHPLQALGAPCSIDAACESGYCAITLSGSRCHTR